MPRRFASSSASQLPTSEPSADPGSPAVQTQDWSSQRIVRELKPAVLAACAEISALLSDTNSGAA